MALAVIPTGELGGKMGETGLGALVWGQRTSVLLTTPRGSSGDRLRWAEPCPVPPESVVKPGAGRPEPQLGR